MADKMTFELVSPERKLASGEADMVVITRRMAASLGSHRDVAPADTD